ncbi:MAG: PAS domain S-box protein [Acidimicrobiales bacterium]
MRLMPDAAVVVDDHGFIVAANALAEALFGYPTGGLSGEWVDDLVPERLRSSHAVHRATYSSHPTQRPMGAGLELWARRRDGREFSVDISLAPLGVPERPLTLAAVRDLTQRRADWAEMGRLAAIVSASEDAIVSMDLKGTVTSWNPGAQRLLGYRAEQIVGRPIFRLVPAEHRGEIEEHLTRMRAGMHMSTRDTSRLRMNGQKVDVSESMSVIRDASGEPIGFTWLMRDVTERKLAELEQRRLLVETQRRERWIAAISEIRLNLLAGGGLGEWLRLIARRVCELADTEGAAILLTPESPGPMTVAASEGELMSRLGVEDVAADGSIFGAVLRSGETWTSSRLARTTSEPTGDTLMREHAARRDHSVHRGPVRRDLSASRDLDVESWAWPSSEDRAQTGPLMLTPLTTSHGAGGVLVVSRAPGREEFDGKDLRMLESIAQQAGLALEIARARSDREQLALVADRERIARDLHDHVIQRLFAVGMTLQAAIHSITDTRVLERINDSVEELDAAIHDVRSAVFSLKVHADEHVGTSACSRILEATSVATAGLGFQPRLEFDGPVDARVPEELMPDVLAVIRNAMSNAAGHGASTLEVRIEVHDDLVVTVTNDRRVHDGTTGSIGLTDMRARAESRQGSMSVGPADDPGTRIEWRVPLPE